MLLSCLSVCVKFLNKKSFREFGLLQHACTGFSFVRSQLNLTYICTLTQTTMGTKIVQCETSTLPTADSWYRKPSPGVPLLSAAERRDLMLTAHCI